MIRGRGRWECRSCSPSRPPERLETETNHLGNQSCLRIGVPIRTLDTEAQVSFSGWQYCVCIFTHGCQQVNAVLTSQEMTSGTRFGTFLDFILYAFSLD